MRATRPDACLHFPATGVIAALLVTCCLPVAAEQKPDFTGVWKLRTERPKYSEVWTVRQTDKEIRIRMNIIDDQLGDRVMDFAAPIDGKEHKQTVIGTQASVTAAWQGSDLRLEIRRQARPDLMLHNSRVLRLSSDRKQIESRLTQHSPPPRTERNEIFDRSS
jgi:hypothetical protein